MAAHAAVRAKSEQRAARRSRAVARSRRRRERARAPPTRDVSPASQKRTESNMTGTPKRAPREEPRSARLFVGARRGFQFLRKPRNVGETPRRQDSSSRVMRLAMLAAHTFSPSSSIAFRQKMRSFWSSVIGSLSTSSISRFGVLQGRSLPKRIRS